jgi:hypothetical protein
MASNPLDKRVFSNKEIENKAISYVMEYLQRKGENPKKQKHGADVISNGKYIDVKGCLKRETNIRMTKQALDSINKAGKMNQGSFFIYYVYDIDSENPKLMIFDHDTFEKNKVEEKKWIIQPFKIKKETDSIQLPKRKS